MADAENPQPSSSPKPVVSERDDTMDSKSATDPTSNALLLHEGFEPTNLENTAQKENIENLEEISQNSRQDIRTSSTAEVPESPKTEVEIPIRKSEDEVQDKLAGASDGTKPPQGTIDNGTPSKVDDHAGSSAPIATPPMDSAVEKELLSNASKDSASSHSSQVEIETDDESEEGKSEADRGLLHAAASLDDNEMEIRRWLEKKPNLLSTNDLGETALHLAIRYGNDKSISVLLEVWKNEKLDINIKDGDGWTPLYTAVSFASMSGPGKIVSKLLRFSEIDLAVKTDYGRTPLYLACYYGNVEVAELLLKEEKGLETLEIQEGQGRNWTPLLVACSEGELKIVELLLSPEYGANTDAIDVNERTPLHLASCAGKYGSNIVQTLLSAQKSLLNKVDSKGCTALHLAVQNLDESGNDGLAFIQELLNAKPQVDIADFNGHTALQYAGRGQDETYTKAIYLISGELDQRKRKEAFWEIFLNEDQPARSRLLDNLKWDDFQNSEMELIKHEATLINIVIPPLRHAQATTFKAYQGQVFQMLKTKREASKPWSFPLDFSHKDLSALQLAAYFGYNRLVYVLLLYSDSEWNEIKQDRDNALIIAKFVEKQVLEQVKRLKSNKSSKEGMEAREKKRDFKDIIDVLNDPPAGNYDLVQGWSEVDELDLKPEPNESMRKFSETVDATIVDFHKVKDPKGGLRVDFLRRTRSVWDVVYAMPPDPRSLEGDFRPKPILQEGDNKSKPSDKKPIDKKKSKTTPGPAPPTKSLGEATNSGPVNIMEAARKKTAEARSGVKVEPGMFYTKENLEFRWLHLSANNLEWMMDLTKRVCRESEWSKENFQPLAEFFHQSWHETPGKRPYMQPSCIKEDPPAWTSQPETPAVATESSQSRGAHKAPPYSRVALYMPYITFADYPPTPEDDPEAEVSGTKQTNNDADRSTKNSEAKNMWKIQQNSQTLDQFYYHSLDNTKERDEDQVVSRYIEKFRKKTMLVPEGKKTILRVDQVWLWVIDHRTIITCSSKRLDEKPDPVLEGIFSYLREAKGKRKGQPPPATVGEMSKFITTFCIDQIDKDTYELEKGELSARQIFANTLLDKANEESNLAKDFKNRIEAKLETLRLGKRRTKKTDEEQQEEQQKDYKSIEKATNLLIEVKDIRDELNILNYLLTQQKSVWKKLMGLHENEDGATNWNDSLRKEAEKWKGPRFALKAIIEMDKVAKSIQDSVNSLLGLEQNEANISEAETSRELSQETIRQGSTIMVFTIITIVFLPMSFLTSLFALNVTTFPHVGDTLIYKPEFIFPIIFIISAVIALPILDFASKKWASKLLDWIYSTWVDFLTGIKNKKPPTSSPPTSAAQKQAPPVSQISIEPSSKNNTPEAPSLGEGPISVANPNVESKPQLMSEITQSNYSQGKTPSLQNRTETKEVSPSASQKEDGQQLAYGESNEYGGVRRRLLGFLDCGLGRHVADEERGSV